jgi:TonB family protein
MNFSNAASLSSYNLPMVRFRGIVGILFLLAVVDTVRASELAAARSTNANSGVRLTKQSDSSYPRCVYCPAPPFKALGKKKDIAGTVVLKVVVSAEGLATRLDVDKSVSPERDEQAVNAVKKWKFKPATTPDGDPVETTTAIAITFAR